MATVSHDDHLSIAQHLQKGNKGLILRASAPEVTSTQSQIYSEPLNSIFSNCWWTSLFWCVILYYISNGVLNPLDLIFQLKQKWKMQVNTILEICQ